MVDFVGGTGPDTWLGTEQSDTAAGSGGDDSLTGNGGDDILSGGDGADSLDGGSGNDLLFSQNRDPAAFAFFNYRGVSLDFGTEADTLIGGGGDDYIVAGYGDSVDGGAQGFWGDRLYVTFRGATSGVSADFRLLLTPGGTITIGGAVIRNIESIGYLEGSNYDDFLVPMDRGQPTGADVYGLGGNDTIIATNYSGWAGSGLFGGDGDDVIDGRPAGYDPIDGRPTGYVPVIHGDAGNDTLYGSLGGYSDVFGGDGDDVIYAHNRINGGSGNDVIHIVDSGYASQIDGGTGDDIIYVNVRGTGATAGGDGNDVLIGNTGWDILTGGSGNDSIDGGSQSVVPQNFQNPYGGDIATYGGNASNYMVTRDAETGIVTVADQRPGSPDGIDTLINVEFLRFASGVYSLAAVVAGQASDIVNFVGTSGGDIFYGNEDANTAFGGDGKDRLYGAGGADVLQGNAGRDTLDGGTGDDKLFSANQTQFFAIPSPMASWTPLLLDIGNEIDTLSGGDGDDAIFVGYGDAVDGGAGTDKLYLSVQGASSGVTLDFRQTAVANGTSTITGIEEVQWLEGSAFADDFTLAGTVDTAVFGKGGDDRLIGGSGRSYLDGGDGNDFIDGRSSGDRTTIVGGTGNDILYAALSSPVYGDADDDTIYAWSSGSSSIFGGEGNDTLIGMNGRDILTGGAGNDMIDGGDQSTTSPFYQNILVGDVAVYTGNVSDYSVTRNSETGVVTIVDLRPGSPDGTDSLTNVEFLRFSTTTHQVAAVIAGQASGVVNYIGTANADFFYGGEDSNIASGQGGDDTIYGFGGDDFLRGNGGVDMLDGGAGDDTLYANNPSGSYDVPLYFGNSWTAPTLDTAADADTLIGGDGSDIIFAGYNDTISGGTDSGYDALLISFMGASSGVTADFRQATIGNGSGTISGIEDVRWVQGSNYDDDIVLGPNYTFGSSVPVFGMGGNDRLVGGAYTGYMDGGDGDDIVDGRGTLYLRTVIGGAGNDTLYTASGFAQALGGDGDDIIYGHYTIDGGSGNDTIYIQQTGYGGQVLGGTGDDLIFASPYGNNTIFGGDGNDTHIGDVGNDNFDGGAGNDRVTGGGGLNMFRGGAGNDRFEVTAADTGTVIEGGADLDTLAVSGAFAPGFTFTGIEIVELDAATLTLTGAKFGTGLAANSRLGGNGSIVVAMESGATINAAGFTLAAGAAVTLTVNGSAQNDTVSGVNGVVNTLNGAGGNDVLRGGTSGDTLRGDIGNDTLDGGTGADTMDGGAGDDIVSVDNDADVVIGGDGIDTVRLVSAVTHMAASDVERFENVGEGDVLAILNALANSYVGGGGGDLVYGGNGADTLAGGAGIDSLFGESGDDMLDGGAEADKLDGGADNDIISGGADGDSLRGGDGDDVLDGGSGNDAMTGGAGIDIFTGGEGIDKFRFRDGDTGNTLATADRITDLDQAQGERISLTLMDASIGGVDDAFTFIGTAAFGNVAGELRYEVIGGNTYVMGDTDGDGASDFMIRVDGAVTLTSADFSL